MLINIHTHRIADADITILNSYPDVQLPDLESPHKLSCGIHPWYIHQFNAEEALSTLEWHCSHGKIQVLGECGLDVNIENISFQKEIFIRQIELSEKYGLPIIIHSVKTHHFILELRNQLNCNQPWLVHGYTGSKETAQQFAKQNIFISFGKFLIRHSERADTLINQTDLNFILLETDDSDYKIEEIYNQAASLLKIPTPELEHIMHSNYIRFFK